MNPLEAKRYPKPGEEGGRLIRKIMALLKRGNMERPIDSHILIAVSGGADSIALATLIGKYGRRGFDRDRLTLAHFNHRWRAGASDRDEQFVRDFAQKIDLPLVVGRGKKSVGPLLEAVAREARYAFLRREAAKLGATPGLIITAHQAEDLAETVLWRVCTGNLRTHGGGILFNHEGLLRPLLTTTKAEILRFLEEEKQTFCLDKSNFDLRFLRARMRKEIFPALQGVFPNTVKYLVEYALEEQLGPSRSTQ